MDLEPKDPLFYQAFIDGLWFVVWNRNVILCGAVLYASCWVWSTTTGANVCSSGIPRD